MRELSGEATVLENLEVVNESKHAEVGGESVFPKGCRPVLTGRLYVQFVGLGGRRGRFGDV